jgi:hypothetical protein
MSGIAFAVAPLAMAETTTNAVSITDSVTSILGVGSQVMNFITGDNLLMTLFCGSLVGLGCYVISKVKKVAKH